MMRKNKSLYQFLVGIMMISLLLPLGNGVVNAEAQSEVGSLTIHKFEQEPGAKQGEGDGSAIDESTLDEVEPLEGVTFTLTQTHSYDPATDKWAEFDGTAKNYVTDAAGKIEINGIGLGRYKVKETAGPPNVVLNTNEYFVDIPMTSEDGTDVNYNVHIYPKNEIIRGEAELTKTDGDSETVLGGVTFTLFNGDDEIVKEGLTTDGNGKIKVDNLPFGQYYFQETGTVDGYLLNGKHVEFSITEQGESAEVSLANYVKPEIEKEVDESAVNRGEIVTYTLTIDLPGDIKNYDSFVVKDVLHDNLVYVDGSQSDPAGFTFVQDGQTLTWTATPSELSSGTIEISFEAQVSENAAANIGIDNTATIDYDNSYDTDSDASTVTVTPTAGTLTVVKQDGDTRETLAGAEFDLMQGDTIIASGTTDSNGEIDFGELDFGEYQLVETKAPEGYNKLRNPINVTVNDSNLEQIITIDNYQSGWELPKTGGMGTLFFTLVGLTFMSAALTMYIHRRRGETA